MLFSRCFVHTLLLCASFLQVRTPILTAKHQFCIITGDFFSAEAMPNHFLCIFVYKKGKKCALHKERCEKKAIFIVVFPFCKWGKRNAAEWYAFRMRRMVKNTVQRCFCVYGNVKNTV